MNGSLHYDVVVIGAGSVGLPTAVTLAEEGCRVLVIEALASAGQGQNKAAIGGVRATHSDPAKILLCKESLKIFKEWQDRYGQDIGYKEGGYCFPAFREREESVLKGLLPIQQGAGLRIDWVEPAEIEELIPGIIQEGLRGGTFSPHDAQVSSVKAAQAFNEAGRRLGVNYCYREPVRKIIREGTRVVAVQTDKGTYGADKVIIAAGAEAREVGRLAGLDLPVVPDSHEAGITAPVKQFLAPLVVDIRPGPEGKTANFYFGQNSEGQLIFCYTPKELFLGTNRESLSEFMPIIAQRLVNLVPRLAHLLVRRVWRGLYPMTPDGLPIVDVVREVDGLYVAVGMCGQGFMLGPGVGCLLRDMVLDRDLLLSPEVMETISLYRSFDKGKELLK